MSWIQTAKVGQRVVCINDRWGGPDVRLLQAEGYIFPKKHNIYTIREIRPDSKNIGLLFEEIPNSVVHTVGGILEVGFIADRFKPLDESRLDIFRAMLVEKPQHADA